MLPPLHLGHKVKSTLFLILIISALFLNTTAHAQESTLAYERLDILINLESGGDYTVTETQLISFDDEYRFGFLEIPLEFTESIEVLTVNDALGPYQRNGTGPGSYTVEQEGDALYVDWEMPATSAGETRLFTISYRVTGGLFVFPTYQQLDWELFPADRGGLPIKASTITVIFPGNIDQETVQPTLAGMDAAETFSNRSLIYISNAPIPDGTAARLVIAYDAALAPDAATPSWQPSNLQPDPAIQFGEGDAVVDNLSILIEVQPDGDLIVTERQTVTFTGRFEYGFLEIPSQFAAYIDILSVADEFSSYVKADGGAATYQTEEERGVTEVTWQFEPTQGITTREFVVTYRIFEGIFVYPQENQLDFSFIGVDDASPPKNATLQVKFPQPLTAYNMQASSSGVALQRSLLNGILQFDLIEETTPRLWSDIFIQFDPALTPDATPPDWQVALVRALAARAAAVAVAGSASSRRD